ncbi:EcsC family protein [Fibrobacter sp.]|uniref:EcsC family protein n=1 Tax=Fibrobacter sp. TaxID=35828 RepID=UPI00387082EA
MVKLNLDVIKQNAQKIAESTKIISDGLERVTSVFKKDEKSIKDVADQDVQANEQVSGELDPQKEIKNENSADNQSNVVVKAIDKIYGVVVDGSIPGVDSASDLAKTYLAKYKTPIKAANALVRWQNTKAAVDGAITGFGGFATMIATLPINVSSILFIQIRMIAAIAYIGGIRDLRNDQLQTAVKCCLLGESVQSFLKKAGIKTTEKVFVKKIMPKITGKMITKINRAIGFRFLTKGGSTGIVNIGKMVPVLGCVVGSIFDGVSTNIVGNAAIKTFIERDCVKEDLIENGNVDINE